MSCFLFSPGKSLGKDFFCNRYIYLLAVSLVFGTNSFSSFIMMPPEQWSTSKPGSWHLNFNAFGVLVDGHFDDDGNESDLASTDDYSLYEGELELGYKISPLLFLWGGVRYRSLSSDRFDANQSEIYGNDEADIESVRLAAMLQLVQGGWYRFDGIVSLRNALYNDPDFRENDPGAFVVLGDGGSDFFGGGVLRIWSEILDFESMLIYRNPGESLSDEVVATIQLAFKMKPTSTRTDKKRRRTKSYSTASRQVARFGVGLQSTLSLNQDDYSDSTPYVLSANRNPQTKPEIGRGATRRFNSVNREMQKAYGFIEFPLGHHARLQVIYGQTLAGRSYDRDQFGLASLQFNFGPRMASSVSGQNSNGRSSMRQKSFTYSSLEGSVLKRVSKNMVEINLGIQQGIEENMILEFYSNGSSYPTARGRVVGTQSSSARVLIFRGQAKRGDRFKTLE